VAPDLRRIADMRFPLATAMTSPIGVSIDIVRPDGVGPFG